MHSPAAAFAWEFLRRHRWGFTALGAYMVALAAIKLLVLGSAQRIEFESGETFGFVVAGPITATFIYFLAVFTYGLSGDIAGRESMYPARMFTMPLTTHALVAWPMLYGTAAMALLWFATPLFTIWPSDVPVPVLWPALLAASLLAWTQALTWMPYPLRGVRVAISVFWLATIDAIVMIALYRKPSETTMLLLLAPHVPLAYVTARFAVGRARRGDVPDWRPFGRDKAIAIEQRSQFRSPAQAQEWFEWRRFGRSLPVLVAIVLPFELAMLFIFRETPAIVFESLVCVVSTPPLMGLFVAATAGKSGGDSYRLTPFIAARPMTSTSLVAAKLKVTMWSTIITWLILVPPVVIALRASGTWPLVADLARTIVKIFGVPRAIALALLTVTVLLASTWKQLVQSLYIGMSGREWAVKASVFVPLSLLAILGSAAHWIFTSRPLLAAVWNAFPWILAAFVCAKTALAGWIVVRLSERRLISDRMLLTGAACWSATVFVLYGLLAWIFPEMIVRHWFLALIAILEVPLVRLSATPLALAGNRHR